MTIDANLAELVSAHSPAVGARMRASIGFNFGSRYLAGHSTLPAGQSLPPAARQTATDIIAFDALIENVDRRQTNPNLLVKGNSVRAFDHETAFAFVYDIFKQSRFEKLAFLRQHALYATLQGRDLDLSGFLAALTGITDGDLATIRASIPEGFGTSYLDKICDHIRLAGSEAEDFAAVLRTVLK